MKLYYHPLSTYCQKVLIAFKEKKVRFEKEIIDLRDPKKKEEYCKVYPMMKIPLLILDNDWKVPESSIIVEYLENHFSSGTQLIPKDRELARQVRFQDRLYDCYLNESATQLWHEGMKPSKEQNKEIMDKAHYQINTMYGFMEKNLRDKTWSYGDHFTMADCSVAPVLGYLRDLHPFDNFANVKNYWTRISGRESYQQVLEEAAPYLEKYKNGKK